MLINKKYLTLFYLLNEKNIVYKNPQKECSVLKKNCIFLVMKYLRLSGFVWTKYKNIHWLHCSSDWTLWPVGSNQVSGWYMQELVVSLCYWLLAHDTITTDSLKRTCHGYQMICQSFIPCPSSKMFCPKVTHPMSFTCCILQLLWHPEHTWQWRQSSPSKERQSNRLHKRVHLTLQEDRRTYSEGSMSASQLRVKQNGVEQRSCIVQDVLKRGTCSIWDFYSKYHLSPKNTTIEHPFFARFSLSSCRKTPDCIMRRGQKKKKSNRNM